MAAPKPLPLPRTVGLSQGRAVGKGNEMSNTSGELAIRLQPSEPTAVISDAWFYKRRAQT